MGIVSEKPNTKHMYQVSVLNRKDSGKFPFCLVDLITPLYHWETAETMRAAKISSRKPLVSRCLIKIFLALAMKLQISSMTLIRCAWFALAASPCWRPAEYDQSLQYQRSRHSCQRRLWVPELGLHPEPRASPPLDSDQYGKQSVPVRFFYW